MKALHKLAFATMCFNAVSAQGFIQENDKDKDREKENRGFEGKANWVREILGQYKWMIINVIAGILFCALIWILVKMMKKNEDLGDGDEQEEKIVLVSRKIKLPISSGYRAGEKTSLSRDFGHRRKNNEPQEIYKETLIRKLNLSKV